MPVVADALRGLLARGSKFGYGRVKRAPLSPKRGNKNYYKGKGGRTPGFVNSRAHFFAQKKKMLEIIAPDLEGFELKPYVQYGSKRPPQA